LYAYYDSPPSSPRALFYYFTSSLGIWSGTIDRLGHVHGNIWYDIAIEMTFSFIESDCRASATNFVTCFLKRTSSPRLLGSTSLSVKVQSFSPPHLTSCYELRSRRGNDRLRPIAHVSHSSDAEVCATLRSSRRVTQTPHQSSRSVAHDSLAPLSSLMNRDARLDTTAARNVRGSPRVFAWRTYIQPLWYEVEMSYPEASQIRKGTHANALPCLELERLERHGYVLHVQDAHTCLSSHAMHDEPTALELLRHRDARLRSHKVHVRRFIVHMVRWAQAYPPTSTSSYSPSRPCPSSRVSSRPSPPLQLSRQQP
jgi:hypothetical protein